MIYCLRGTCAETEDATQSGSRYSIHQSGLRGTCAETEDATFIFFIHVLLPNCLRGTCAETEDATTFTKGYRSWWKESQRHLRWNRGCNVGPKEEIEKFETVSEALALKQRMQQRYRFRALIFYYSSRGTCAETEDATLARWKSRCAYSPVREALALNQRMQRNDHTYNGKKRKLFKRHLR